MVNQKVVLYVVLFTLLSILIIHMNVFSSDRPMKMHMNEKELRFPPIDKSKSSTKEKTEEVKSLTMNPVTERPSGSRTQEPVSFPFDVFNETEVEGWELGVDRDVKKLIQGWSHEDFISGRHLCSPDIDMLIIVCSAPAKTKERRTIRVTWPLSVMERNVKVGYLLGGTKSPYVENMIDQESFEFNDTIRYSFFTDSTSNLPLKSIAMMKWFLVNCPSVKYLLKIDDDTYVDIPLLRSNLAKWPASGLLRGFPAKSYVPDRNDSSPRYVPRYMYPNTTYPRHLSGAGYIMSRDVVGKLYKACLDTPIVNLEDVYITGLCAEKAGVKRQFMERVKFIIRHVVACGRKDIMCTGIKKRRKLIALHEWKKTGKYSSDGDDKDYWYDDVPNWRRLGGAALDTDQFTST